MNLHDLHQIYQECIATYKRDPHLTKIQINMIFKDTEYEDRTALINVDFRPQTIELKQQKKPYNQISKK